MTTASSLVRARLSSTAVVACALAVVLHAAWWYLLGRHWRPDLQPRPAPAAPRLAYGPETATRAEVLTLGSPVLFALPSPVGFSGDHSRGLDRAPRSLYGLRREPVLLSRAPEPAGRPDYLRSLGQTVAEPEAEPVWRPTATRAFATPAGATGFVLRVYWPEGAPAVRGGLPGAGVLAPLLQDKAWELAAMLVFDDQGAVRNVFVEKPTASRERNEAVARALRGVRIDSGGQESRARVVVQYDQDAGPKAPAGGAVRP